MICLGCGHCQSGVPHAQPPRGERPRRVATARYRGTRPRRAATRAQHHRPTDMRGHAPLDIMLENFLLDNITEKILRATPNFLDNMLEKKLREQHQNL